MSNANTIYQLEAMAAYEPDGFQDFTRYLKETANKYFPADDLTIARINTSAKTDIKTNAGSKIVAIYVKTASGATTTGYLQLFNTSSASVTLGTTPPEEAIKLSNAANVAKVIRFWPDPDERPRHRRGLGHAHASRRVAASAGARGALLRRAGTLHRVSRGI